jgi:hypothetical protein
MNHNRKHLVDIYKQATAGDPLAENSNNRLHLSINYSDG